jgi:beta-glucosidase
VISALRRRNIEPVVTLHHFTNPAWFSHRGGWLRRDSAAIFSRYVARVAEYLGTDVKFWVTINEPTVYVTQGYVNGEWPPCLRGAWMKAAMVLLNLARSHRAAYRVLHHYRRDSMVGFAHSAPLVLPCDPQRRRDRVAARLRDLIVNDAFFYLIGARAWNRPAARRHLDFIGINYYTRMIIRSEGLGIGALLGRACRSAHNHPRGPISDIGWEVYPPGLGMILERFSNFRVPLFVTENGIATNDETLRCDFLSQHLASLAATLKDGVQVIGYLYWSLIDNYEWALGMAPHFGLAAVDAVTQQRLPRPCSAYFADVCRQNRIQPESANEHTL